MRLSCAQGMSNHSWTSKPTAQWWLPLQVFWASSSALAFWEAHLNSNSFSTHIPPRAEAADVLKQSTAWAWSGESSKEVHCLVPGCRSLKSTFPGNFTITSSRAKRSFICPSSKEKHGTAGSRGFKCTRAEIFSMLYFLQRISQLTQAAQSEFKPALSSLPFSPYFSSQDHTHNDGRVWVKSVIYIKVA